MEVVIKRIRSSRSLRLRVLPDGSVTLTCHPLTPSWTISNFIAEHEGWIKDKVTQVSAKRSALVDSPKTLLLRGKKYQFKLQVNSAAKPKIELKNNEIIALTNSEDHVEARKLLEKWYNALAKKYFSERVLLLCDVINHDVMNVTIRSQRTRWGSCSSRKTISLNWRLILTPDWVSDYVIYHELAHLTHMNHSRKFWELVADYFPDYKNAEKWLTDNHSLLQF